MKSHKNSIQDAFTSTPHVESFQFCHVFFPSRLLSYLHHLKWEKAGHPFCQIWGPGSQYVARLGKHSLLPPGFRHECYMNVLWMFLLFQGMIGSIHQPAKTMELTYYLFFFVFALWCKHLYTFFFVVHPRNHHSEKSKIAWRNHKKIQVWPASSPVEVEVRCVVVFFVLVGWTEGGPPCSCTADSGWQVTAHLGPWCLREDVSSPVMRRHHIQQWSQTILRRGWAWCNWCVGLSPKSDTCTVSSTPGWCSSRRV